MSCGTCWSFFVNSIFCVHYFSHTVTVTESLLKDMVSHTLIVRFWDNKEKCSNRARADKPKMFMMPNDEPGKNGTLRMLDN